MVGWFGNETPRKKSRGESREKKIETEAELLKSTYARTQSYQQPATLGGYTLYREVHFHPVKESWFMRQIWSRSNTRTSGPEAPDTIEEGELVRGKKNLSFDQALRELATFERYCEDKKFSRVGADKKEIGADYYEAVAQQQGIALDNLGTLVAGGQSEKKKGLSGLFSTSAKVENFQNILDLKIKLVRFRELYSALAKPLKSLLKIQNNHFETEEKYVFTGLLKANEVKYAAKFQQDLKQARKAVQTSQFISKEALNNYLDELDLAFQIGYAKTLKNELKGKFSEDTRIPVQKELTAHIKKYEPVAEKLGHSMSLHVENEPYFTRLRDMPELAALINLGLSDVGGPRIGVVTDIIYLPASAVEFLVDIRKNEQDLKAQIENEIKGARIVDEHDESAPRHNSERTGDTEEVPARKNAHRYISPGKDVF